MLSMLVPMNPDSYLHHSNSVSERMNSLRDIENRVGLTQFDSLPAYFYSEEETSLSHVAIWKTYYGLTLVEGLIFRPFDCDKVGFGRDLWMEFESNEQRRMNILWQSLVAFHLSNRWMYSEDIFAETNLWNAGRRDR